MNRQNTSEVDQELAILQELVQKVKSIRDSIANHADNHTQPEKSEIERYLSDTRQLNAEAKIIIDRLANLPQSSALDKRNEMESEIKQFNHEIPKLLKQIFPPRGQETSNNTNDVYTFNELLIKNLIAIRTELDDSEYLPSQQEITDALRKIDQITDVALKILERHKTTENIDQEPLPEGIEARFLKELEETREVISELQQALDEAQSLEDDVDQNDADNGNESEIDEQEDESELNVVSEKQEPAISSATMETNFEETATTPVPKKPNDKGKEEVVAPSPAAVKASSPVLADVILQAGTKKVSTHLPADIDALPDSAAEKAVKINEQMAIACRLIEEQMSYRDTNELIQINKCPRNLQKAIVAYCTLMGYPLALQKVAVKFNVGVKEAMIESFKHYLDDHLDLKMIIENKQQYMLAQKQPVAAKSPEMEIAAEPPADKDARIEIEITPRLLEIIQHLEDLEKQIPRAAYLDKQTLEKQLIDVINALDVNDLYAITLKLFADHVNTSAVHLLRSSEGIKKHAYIAFAKKVGYDLRASEETEATVFTLAPDKPYDPRMDVLNWYVRKSMADGNDNDSVCNNIVFCIIGGVRHNPKADDPSVILQESMAIEREKKKFLEKGMIRDSYLSYVVNDTVKQPDPPVSIVVKQPLVSAAKPAPIAPNASNVAQTKKLLPKLSGLFKKREEKPEAKKSSLKTSSSPSLFRGKQPAKKASSEPSSTPSKTPKLGRKKGGE